MASKRALPTKVAMMRERKRRKVEPSPTHQIERKQVNDEHASIKRPTRADELRWTTCDMPDALDNYEGFFGLEEVNGVDVVRDANTGSISYQALSFVDSTTSDQSADRPDEVNDALTKISSDVDSDESWEGFEVNDAVSNLASSAVSKSPSKELHAESNDLRPFKKEVTAGGKPEHDLTRKNAFDVLRACSEKETDVKEWAALNLSPNMLGALSKLGFSRPTSIQRAAIPSILEGRELIGKAPTGSGKTLAFGIPIVEHFHTSDAEKRNSLEALIVLPTRELAHQISDHLGSLSAGLTTTAPRIVTLTGGLSIQKQRRLLDDANIVVATPGRLWEIVSQSKDLLPRLRGIRFLVVDEADRLLSEGHFKELEEVLQVLDRQELDADSPEQAAEPPRLTQRQTLVFSATLAKSLQQKLSKQARFLTNSSENDTSSMEYLLKRLSFRQKIPKFVDVNPQSQSQMPQNLREGIIECPKGEEKDLYLYTVLLHHPKTRILVFVNSISAVRRLVPFCKNLAIPAIGLHSEMPQKARLRSVETFTGSNMPPNESGAVLLPRSVLIATDVAARGIDIHSIDLVIHYHLPRTADMYIHRSGRTARASASGSSILLCSPEESAGVRRLVVQVHASKRKEHATNKDSTDCIHSIDLDGRILGRLRPRVKLSKDIADAEQAKVKKHSEENWMAEAAKDLGVEYDSDTLNASGQAGRQARGRKRKEREREARQWSKSELQARKDELRALLQQRLLGKKGLDVAQLSMAKERGESYFALPKLDF